MFFNIFSVEHKLVFTYFISDCSFDIWSFSSVMVLDLQHKVSLIKLFTIFDMTHLDNKALLTHHFIEIACTISSKTLNQCSYDFHFNLHKKWSFPLNCGFGHIYWRNPSWKTSFFVQCQCEPDSYRLKPIVSTKKKNS